MVGFGIKKLQITLVVEDDKVHLEELQEQIEEFEDYVQSTEIFVRPSALDLLTDVCLGGHSREYEHQARKIQECSEHE
jgi:EF-1 guanine nucleotide exchange domain